MQDRSLAGADAGDELDGDFVAIEAAGDCVAVRGFVVTPRHLECVLILPCAAGDELVLDAGLGHAAGDESRRCAGQGGFATLPSLDAARDGIGGAGILEGDGAAILAECERRAREAEVVGFDLESLAGNAGGGR